MWTAVGTLAAVYGGDRTRSVGEMVPSLSTDTYVRHQGPSLGLNSSADPATVTRAFFTF